MLVPSVRPPSRIVSAGADHALRAELLRPELRRSHSQQSELRGRQPLLWILKTLRKILVSV